MLVTLLSDLRDFFHDLHADQTASITLDDSLRAYIANFTKSTQIVATYDAPLHPLNLPPAIGTCIYRVTQEALANIRLHAKATRASVTTNGLAEAIELVIKDDGQGFEPETVPSSHHLGLTSMRERVEQVHGTMKITSRLEWGTTIVIHSLASRRSHGRFEAINQGSGAQDSKGDQGDPGSTPDSESTLVAFS